MERSSDWAGWLLRLVRTSNELEAARRFRNPCVTGSLGTGGSISTPVAQGTSAAEEGGRSCNPDGKWERDSGRRRRPPVPVRTGIDRSLSRRQRRRRATGTDVRWRWAERIP
jgi:hypothetical protein